ncbi:MAG: ferric iron uptake transcriptional regulator, partial [Gammaproteobacteria bacterium]|nr:ferric iron uptake transcriptional regulator [Gammaproteobacteria bacterium]
MESGDLKKAGLKATAPRRKILQLLEDSDERHLGAEDIYRQLTDSGEDIGLATVYRVLAQFESAGLVTRHNFESGHSVYELDKGAHHDHMVCLETGKVTEFVSREIEEMQRIIADKHD